jgi:hypothetical protein
MKESSRDSNLLEKELTQKRKQSDMYQRELANQKFENQKLREKVRELLSKPAGSFVPSFPTQTDPNSEQRLLVLQEQNSSLERESLGIKQQLSQL